MWSIVIQAGGESSRMGTNKALLPFLGQPLITRVIERLKGLGDEVLVTTNQIDRFEFLHLPLFADILPGKGALGGLYTALFSAKFPLVGVVACDMPFASAALLDYERCVLETEGVDVVIPATRQGYEPLHAVYRRAACLPAVETALKHEQHRLISWFPKVKVRVLTRDEIIARDPDGKAFLNINTPDELTQAESSALSARPNQSI